MLMEEIQQLKALTRTAMESSGEERKGEGQREGIGECVELQDN